MNEKILLWIQGFNLVFINLINSQVFAGSQMTSSKLLALA